MPRIKLNLSRLNVAQKLELAKRILNAMTGNTNFPNPTPTLAQLTTAVNNLEAAHSAAVQARQESKNKTAVQEQMEDIVDDMLTKMAGHVSSIAGDDTVMITGAGMDVAQPKTPSGPLAVPSNLTSTTGDSDGEIDLSYNSVPGASGYDIQMSTQQPTATSWSHLVTTTKSSHTATGLVSGQRYWFRVSAVGPGGHSGWSDITTRIAP